MKVCGLIIMFRYCISTIVRAASGGDKDGHSGVVLDSLDLDEDMIDTEFGDLATLYSGQRINFCDFSQFVLACGEHLHPCYRDNVIEVFGVTSNCRLPLTSSNLF